MERTPLALEAGNYSRRRVERIRGTGQDEEGRCELGRTRPRPVRVASSFVVRGASDVTTCAAALDALRPETVLMRSALNQAQNVPLRGTALCAAKPAASAANTRRQRVSGAKVEAQCAESARTGNIHTALAPVAQPRTRSLLRDITRRLQGPRTRVSH